MKKDVGLTRLKRLLVVLKGVQADPKKRREFDLSSWAEITPECGTHLCACGWGAVDPVLNKQGLRLGRPREVDIAPFWDSEPQMVKVRDIKYGRHDEFAAVSRFFDIDSDDATRLFHADNYERATSMAPVIRRLSAFIKRREATATPAAGSDDAQPQS